MPAAAARLRDAVALCDDARERAPLLVAYADLAHPAVEDRLLLARLQARQLLAALRQPQPEAMVMAAGRAAGAGTTAPPVGAVPASPAWLPWRASAAGIHQALGDHAEAARLLDEQLALRRRWGTPRAVGMALHAAGRAAGGGDEDAALRLLEEAVELLGRSRARLDLARALVDLGAARQRRGDLAGARAQLRRGLRLAQRYGAASLAATAYQALLAAGGRPHGYQQTGWGALTQTERKIASMLVLGRANTEIAQALFITRSTVEHHIRRIYAKLGIQRRPQLLASIIRLASAQPQ